MTRWYEALLSKQRIKEAKKNKYGAKRTADGFPSQLERDVYAELLWMEKDGLVSEIERQSCVRLTKEIKSKIDFKMFLKETEQSVWVEAKGFETERWVLIKKLWKEFGPGQLWIYRGSKGRVFRSEIVHGGMSEAKKDEMPTGWLGKQKP